MIQARNTELEQQHDADYAAFKDFREETQMLWRIKSHIDAALKDRHKTENNTDMIFFISRIVNALQKYLNIFSVYVKFDTKIIDIDT